MSKTMIGVLKKPLIIETEVDGVSSIVVMPKGTVIEILMKESDYDFTTEQDIIDAINCFEEE